MCSRISLLLLLLSFLFATFLQISSGSRQLNEQQIVGQQACGKQGCVKQPGQVAQQPGQVTQQPGKQPGQVYQQPGQVSQQPGQQPGQVSQQPGQQPGQVSQQPGQQPGQVYQQPGQQPGQVTQQPGQQPGQVSQQPGCQVGGAQPCDVQQGRAQIVGMCYGTCADNQPTAQEAVSLAQSTGIQILRLYGPDHNALQSLRNTGIEVVLGIPNEQIESLALSQDNAIQWIQNNVKNYQDVKFRYIVVGNGISPIDAQTSKFAQCVLQAMQNVQNAISACGLQDKVKVTTAVDQSEILIQSYPPSQSQFKPEVRQFIDPIIHFLVSNNNVPLLVNLHPYFSYVHNKVDIPPELETCGKGGQHPRLGYATFQTSDPIVQDGQLTYTNVFDAMVDSVHVALEKAGGSSLNVVVSEIGWPTAGGDAATIEIASTHNNKLINHVLNNGTPKRPQNRIETYIFNMFDENKRDGEEFEKHWGVFCNNKQAKYQINFQFH